MGETSQTYKLRLLKASDGQEQRLAVRVLALSRPLVSTADASRKSWEKGNDQETDFRNTGTREPRRAFVKEDQESRANMLDRFARYALVTDGSPLIRMNIQSILTRAGFRVLTAAGFDDAMEILASRGHFLKLLITDVQRPPGKLTGCDLAFQCARSWPEIGIVVTSGATSLSPGELPEGALFVPKPFSEEMVGRCIHQLVTE
ncbi:hypothetical protein GCM10011402_35750 [Paracoccus acridae]|uniref:Response regulatory domain-containing protein n=1 Tax=Paracoccus acridae TaxID=1795310 RepID=A0ABQ1VM63_9RHOB|nr:hypothetical protein [Paracoccus acridae]GGF80003.1 hypothetical protein GCM10011402_35750 [Paracoccus acridae]